MAIRFDGKSFAASREQELAQKVQALKSTGKTVLVHTITFQEDAGSTLYTKLKQQAALRCGIDYVPTEVSFTDSVDQLIHSIQESSNNPAVTGVMVQKPSKAVWLERTGKDEQAFASWWQQLTNAINPQKDVDCLTQTNLNAIETATPVHIPELLPATVAACLTILSVAQHQLQIPESEWKEKQVLVVGRSAIVGKPLAHVLQLLGHPVTNVGKELSSVQPSNFPILISAVGVPGLLKSQDITQGCVAIDVGSPAGDFDQESIESKASFYTPVPGGVGPVTISCLLQNCVQMGQSI